MGIEFELLNIVRLHVSCTNHSDTLFPKTCTRLMFLFTTIQQYIYIYVCSISFTTYLYILQLSTLNFTYFCSVIAVRLWEYLHLGHWQTNTHISLHFLRHSPILLKSYLIEKISMPNLTDTNTYCLIYCTT